MTASSHVTRKAHRPARLKEIVTPEGVPVRWAIPSEVDRINAFFLDFMVLNALTGALFAVCAVLFGFGIGASWAGAFFMLTNFLIRNFYFMFFETRWQGQTPGKRWMGLQVIERSGGALSTESIIVRNLTRDVEVFLPLVVLAHPQSVTFGESPGWISLLAGGWILVFALLPLFNQDRLRVGDLAAGTLVIARPQPRLLDDISAQHRDRVSAGPSRYSFTQDQLSVYGIYELQTLEDVLRRPEGTDKDVAMETVAHQIGKKIRFLDPVHQPEVFLREFYAAQRAHLEKKLLFGKRKENKFDRPVHPKT